jgi:hypothetical protein
MMAASDSPASAPSAPRRHPPGAATGPVGKALIGTRNGHNDGAQERKGRNVLLKSVTAGVVNIVRSVLALFRGRRRDGESRCDDQSEAAGMMADMAMFSAGAALSAANLAALTVDASAIAAEAATAAAHTAATADHAHHAAAGTGAAAPAAGDAAASAAAPAVTDAVPAAGDAVPAATDDVPAASDAAAAATDDVPAAPDAVPAATDVPPAAGGAAPAIAAAKTAKPRERKVMSSGFDMQAEIAKLAERIIEPVAARLTAPELEQVTGRIRDVFEQFNTSRAVPDAGFTAMAAGILDPVQASLTDAERKRAADRLGGAMAAFCQGLRAA